MGGEGRCLPGGGYIGGSGGRFREPMPQVLNNASCDDGQQNCRDEELFSNRESKHQTFFLFAPHHTWVDAGVQRLMNDSSGRFWLGWIPLFCASAYGLLLPVMSLTASDKPLNAQEQLATDMKSAQLAQSQTHVSAGAADVERIRKIYADLIAKYPQSADPRAAFGEFLASQGHDAEARRQWEEALKIDPDRADIYAAESGIVLRVGNTVEATRFMELAVEKAPTNASYHFRLAHLYFLFRHDLVPVRKTTETAMFAIALDHFRKAAELAPMDADYGRVYAETFYSLPNADWHAALAAWKKLLPLTNEPSFVHAQMARVSLRLKNKSAARHHLAQVTDPQFATLKKTLQRQLDAL